MEPKTSLNNTQRKMLDEVFKERIKKNVNSYRERRQDERQKMANNILETAKKSKEVKEITKLYKDLKAKEAALKKQGIKISTSYNSDNLEVKLGDRYDDTKPPKLELFDETTRLTDEKITEASTEVRARIYGMDTSYEQVDKELLEFFSFLDK